MWPKAWKYVVRSGVVIAILAGLFGIVEGIQRCSSLTPTNSTQPTERKSPFKVTGSLTVKPAHNPSRVDSSGALWSCEGVAEDQKQALAAALKLQSNADRDGVLLSVSRNSLCYQDFDTFEKAAAAFYFSVGRDRAYMNAVIFMVERRGLSVAQKYALKITDNPYRDKALKLIVDAAATEPSK